MIVPADEAFNMCLAVLRRSGVIAVPTDTVYGLAALAADEQAMSRLFAVKGRASDKSIAVLVGDLGQARALCTDPLDEFAPYWPGPLTVVVTRRPGAALHLGLDDTTVGIRCPAHNFVRRLAQEIGPLATTSANAPGEPTPPTAAEVAALFDAIGLVVDGGACRGAPSTVIDATVRPPRVLRAGPISAPDWVTEDLG